MWKNCVEEAVLIFSHNTWKTLRLQGTYHNEHFVHFYFSYANQICLRSFFLCFSLSQVVVTAVASIKDKNVLSSKIKFRKSYWISNSNINVACVIGWFFIILFSFSLSFIYTSFLFVVGSCNFDAPKNLKCVRQQGLFDIKYLKFLILFIIPRETLYSPKTYLPYVTSAF